MSASVGLFFMFYKCFYECFYINDYFVFDCCASAQREPSEPSSGNLAKEVNAFLTENDTKSDQCLGKGLLSSWKARMWGNLVSDKSLNQNNKIKTILQENKAEKTVMETTRDSCQTPCHDTLDTRQIHRLESSEEDDRISMHVKNRHEGTGMTRKCYLSEDQQMQYLEISSPLFLPKKETKDDKQDQGLHLDKERHEEKEYTNDNGCMSKSILGIDERDQNHHGCKRWLRIQSPTFPMTQEGEEITPQVIMNGGFSMRSDVSRDCELSQRQRLATQISHCLKDTSLIQDQNTNIEGNESSSRKEGKENPNGISEHGSTCSFFAETTIKASESQTSSGVSPNLDENLQTKELTDNANEGQQKKSSSTQCSRNSSTSSSTSKEGNRTLLFSSQESRVLNKTNNSVHQQGHHRNRHLTDSFERSLCNIHSASNSIRGASHRSSIGSSSRVRSPDYEKTGCSAMAVSLQSERRAVIMARAKKRTLRMSISIVVTFCVCEYNIL